MRVLASEAPALGKQALAEDLQQQLSQAHAREADLQRNVAQLQFNVAQSRQQLQDAQAEHAQVRRMGRPASGGTASASPLTTPLLELQQRHSGSHVFCRLTRKLMAVALVVCCDDLLQTG